MVAASVTRVKRCDSHTHHHVTAVTAGKKCGFRSVTLQLHHTTKQHDQFIINYINKRLGRDTRKEKKKTHKIPLLIHKEAGNALVIGQLLSDTNVAPAVVRGALCQRHVEREHIRQFFLYFLLVHGCHCLGYCCLPVPRQLQADRTEMRVFFGVFFLQSTSLWGFYSEQHASVHFNTFHSLAQPALHNIVSLKVKDGCFFKDGWLLLLILYKFTQIIGTS